MYSVDGKIVQIQEINAAVRHEDKLQIFENVKKNLVSGAFSNNLCLYMCNK